MPKEAPREQQPGNISSADELTAAQDTETEVQPEQEQLDESIPETYRGKAPAELARMLDEKEAFIKRQADEIGEHRKKISDYESRYFYEQTLGRKPGYGGQPGQEGYYQDPYGGRWDNQGERVQATQPARPDDGDFITYGDIKRMTIQQQQKDSQIRQAIQMTKSQFEQAKKDAPGIFKGLNDQEVLGAVYNYASSGQLDPMSLMNPRTWKMAATFVQGEKTDYSFTPAETVSNPVAAPFSEKPIATRPVESEEESDIEITDELRRYAKEELGIENPTDEKLRALIEKGRGAKKEFISGV